MPTGDGSDSWDRSPFGCSRGGRGTTRLVASPAAPSRAATAPGAAAHPNGGRDRADRRPLGPFFALIGVYSSAVVGAAILAHKRNVADRFTPWDLLLLGIATHKLSRRISKDSITSPLREPFAEYEERGGPGEVNEEPRGHGFQQAIGELVTCPFCIGQWIATALVFGLAFAPRVTRLIAGIFASAAVADFLQFAYARAQQAAEEG
jgi:hypothetical protein